MDTIKTIAGMAIGLAVWAASVAFIAVIGGFYVIAATEGVGELLGWHGWWVIAVLVALVTLQIGLLPIILLGAYGAYYGWEWPWWGVLAAFFPGIFIGLAGGLLALLRRAVELVFSRRRRIDPA